MNKRLTLIIILTWCLLTIQAKDIYVSTSFHEPATEGLRFIYSYDGIKWDSIQGVFLQPKVGVQKVMRDPSIVKGPDGTFHLVWTSSWRGDRGFGYASSKDLIHWTEQRFIEVMKDTSTVNVWAPELFYDDVKKQFMIIWASCIPGKFPDYQEDHKNNHRLYYTTTKDFKKFSETKLFYDPDFSDIDATLVKRGKNDSIYARLDVQFTFEQATQQSIAVKGAGVTHNSVRQMLKNWRKQGLVVLTAEGRYRKVDN